MTMLHPTADAFRLGDDVVLFAESSGDLFLLNQVAARLWLGLSRTGRLQDAVDELVESYRVSRAEAERDCRSLVSEWRRHGLLRDDVAPAVAGAETANRPALVREQFRAKVAGTRAGPTVVRDYRLADFAFRLRTGTSAVEASVHEYLAHLAVPEGEDRAAPLFDLHADETKFALRFDGREFDRCTEIGELIPMMHGNLVMAAYRFSDCLLAVHAACVTKGDLCVLLAGHSGAGKSTLVSALLGEGFDYLSDDTVLLSTPPVRVQGIRMPLCLKEPSWSIVAERWPESSSRPIHRRRDGKRVRYWLPRTSDEESNGAASRSASALVFSRYSPTSSNALRRINAGEALMRLTQSGYDTREMLSADTVRALVGWIADMPCFELEYDAAHVAVAHLESLGQ